MILCTLGCLQLGGETLRVCQTYSCIFVHFVLAALGCICISNITKSVLAVALFGWWVVGSFVHNCQNQSLSKKWRLYRFSGPLPPCFPLSQPAKGLEMLQNITLFEMYGVGSTCLPPPGAGFTNAYRLPRSGGQSALPSEQYSMGVAPKPRGVQVRIRF